MWAFANQGEALAYLPEDRAVNPEVKELASAMSANYGALKLDITALYQEDGLALPPAVDFKTDIRDGMLPLDVMNALANTQDAGFDVFWLESMTAHHESLIVALEPALSSPDPRVKALAEKAVASQAAELERMEALLTSL